MGRPVNGSPLFADFYHFTMAQGMFRDGSHMRPETYEMYIRECPFEGSYLLTAGMGEVLEWLDAWKFEKDDLEFLKSCEVDGKPAFDADFLEMLGKSKLQITVDALPEGELAFPNEPIVRVSGPAYQCEMVEAGILNIVNPSSLIATKASRIHYAANADGKARPVMEFGLRRAQDRYGLMPTRSAMIGGAGATSNVYAAKLYGLKAAGTMAHCFVMREAEEQEAFVKFLSSNPNNGTLLPDTYDTLQGVQNAMRASKQTGVPLRGLRLDSGDLAYFAKKVRAALDLGGFSNTLIGASNDLDEYKIVDLLAVQKAPIDFFGVGTMLVTAHDQPALGGVYKVKETGGLAVMKISENPIKTTVPGATSILRMLGKEGHLAGDVVVKASDSFLDKDGGLSRRVVSLNPANGTSKAFAKGERAYMPLVRMMEGGKADEAHMCRKVTDIRAAAQENLKKLDSSHRRFQKPHIYVAGREEGLDKTFHKMRDALLSKIGASHER